MLRVFGKITHPLCASNCSPGRRDCCGVQSTGANKLGPHEEEGQAPREHDVNMDGHSLRVPSLGSRYHPSPWKSLLHSSLVQHVVLSLRNWIGRVLILRRAPALVSVKPLRTFRSSHSAYHVTGPGRGTLTSLGQPLLIPRMGKFVPSALGNFLYCS